MKRIIYNELAKKIEKLEKILNGGKGSGNFGHAGRPGEVGGSSNTQSTVESKDSGIGRSDGPDITQHMANTAVANIDKAIKEEPETSALLKKIFKDNNSSFTGFEYRVKTKKSLAEKIARDLEDDGKRPTNKNIQNVANGIHDNLRYTALCNKNTFYEQYKGIMRDLEKNGYEIMKVKNTLKDTGVEYRGVNTFIKNKNGYIFELQFHTAQSVKIKEKNHVSYNITRDKKTPIGKVIKLRKQMIALSNTIEMPKGVENIEAMNKMKG